MADDTADNTTGMSDNSDNIDPSPTAASPADADPAEPGAPAAPQDTMDGQPEDGIDDPYAAPPPDPHEGAVPPGYDWPTHGGYLGCLLGLVAACTLSGFLGGTWFAILAAPSWVKLTITLVIALVAFIGLGRLGWVLGKRYYREYPQPVRGQTTAAPLTGGATQAGDTPPA